MGIVVMDALSHQAIRALGTEGVHYGAPPDRTGQWRGNRLTGLENSLVAMGHSLRFAAPASAELASADVLIIASRSQDLPLSADELAAIRDFVLAGGGLLLMANHRHFIRPQQQVAAALQLPFGFKDLTIIDFPEIEVVPHPLTTGCGQLLVRNSTALAVAAEAEVVARFVGDRTQVFAAAASVGGGRVLATGDSGFIASLDDAGKNMFESASNARFVANAIDWLSGAR